MQEQTGPLSCGARGKCLIGGGFLALTVLAIYLMAIFPTEALAQ